MRYLLLLSITLLYTSAGAQVLSPEFQEFWLNVDQLKSLEQPKNAAYTGSPYLFESENTSSVFLNDTVKIDGLTIRYNVHNDKMEIKKDGVYYEIPKEKIIPQVMLDTHHFILMPYLMSHKKRTAYFESLVQGSRLDLYLKHKVILKEPEEPKPYQEAKLAAFKSSPPKIFIDQGDGVLVYVKDKKDFLKQVPNKTDELESFIKKNKTKFRKPDNVKKLVEYYNTL